MRAEKAAASLVDELVHQFTDPFAFYRELIANSIDAGSTHIEVTLSFRPSAEVGLCVATVADWGEGMNRRIIEDCLVTKFRSPKENDLTKIGKFGIGFVSVFACKPDAVTVDTGRDGESWRVLFRADTSYALLRPKAPVEGTVVTIYKRMRAAEYDHFSARSLEAVKSWCRHSEVEITFSAGGPSGPPPPEPKAVQEPLTIDAPFQVEHIEEGTHIVAGPCRVEPPSSGFYNRGLTLLETTDHFINGVTFKILSRWLEHTLTRDNVRRDKHFSRAMSLTEALVDGKLRQALPEELRKAAGRKDKDGRRDWEVLFRYAQPRLASAKLCVRQSGGGAIAWNELQRALGRPRELFFSAQPTALVDRLKSAGVPVLDLEPGPLLKQIQSLLSAKAVRDADDAFTFAHPPTAPRAPGFTSALVLLLSEAKASVRDVLVTELAGAARDEPFGLFEAPGRPLRLEQVLRSPFARSSPSLLVLNRNHLSIATAEPLFARAPRLAAVLMARLVLVHWSLLDEKTDRRLTEWALA